MFILRFKKIIFKPLQLLWTPHVTEGAEFFPASMPGKYMIYGDYMISVIAGFNFYKTALIFTKQRLEKNFCGPF